MGARCGGHSRAKKGSRRVVLVGSQAEDGDCTERDADPTRACIVLTGGDGCIAQARRHAADFLTRLQDKHGLDVSEHTVGMTQLVVSELVTNALKYAPGPVLMELRIAGAQVEITVRDSSPGLPSLQATDPDPDRVGRHGLEIVRAVAQHLDIRREPGGKRITARITLTDIPGTGTADRDVP
ncbi:ATP-binding protein [Streptomyces sp. NBC_00285]|uniref:ATP-binding protein n=1 Tax=Streptomyces sp. NBC_00285 TaxID=2975700 RepID=UPI002E2B0150|nr:ATP-binding protein [Streptomyces sp. NBC_00285]